MKKVVARITGGLGNQMFGYAVALAIARRTGRELYFDLTDFVVFFSGRKYQLKPFAGPSKVPHWSRLRSTLYLLAWIVNKRVSGRVFPFLLRAMKLRLVSSERIFEFDDLFLDDRLGHCVETLYLQGVYGHVPYIPDEDTLRDRFRFVQSPVGRNRAYSEQFERSPSVSVHIRRSDYLSVDNGNIVLDAEYYQKAFRVMSLVEPSPLWVIFSDDIPWCRTQFGFLQGAIYVDGNEGEPWEDLRLMASCKHHIIANSTFSWWGAYLGRDRSGTTLYPEYWFPTLRTIPTMVKEGWVAVPSFANSRGAAS
jgi:hypothetical protein